MESQLKQSKVLLLSLLHLTALNFNCQLGDAQIVKHMKPFNWVTVKDGHDDACTCCIGDVHGLITTTVWSPKQHRSSCCYCRLLLGELLFFRRTRARQLHAFYCWSCSLHLRSRRAGRPMPPPPRAGARAGEQPSRLRFRFACGPPPEGRGGRRRG